MVGLDDLDAEEDEEPARGTGPGVVQTAESSVVTDAFVSGLRDASREAPSAVAKAPDLPTLRVTGPVVVELLVEEEGDGPSREVAEGVPVGGEDGLVEESTPDLPHRVPTTLGLLGSCGSDVRGEEPKEGETLLEVVGRWSTAG